ncbi:MAG: hypothetical protein HFF69_13415 [Oscillospiraceae bacterium]|nr:hypothetical protein [Oscillospiraceae bacterium]
MNEITKHVANDREYYSFALANAQNNLQTIYKGDTTYHIYPELLMAMFEVYDRAVECGITMKNFNLQMFLNTIFARADRQLNRYFYPEYAMYMANPKRMMLRYKIDFPVELPARG